MQRQKINPEILGSVFSLCCRAGIDAALVKADFFFAGAPTIENKIEQKIQNTKVASAKVAFDTVRPTIIIVTLSRGRVLSVRALRLLLIFAVTGVNLGGRCGYF